MEDSANSGQPELSSDEEWKERVQAENAAVDEKLDEKLRADNNENLSAPADAPETPTAAENDESRFETNRKGDQPSQSFLPAEFSTLVGMLSAQTMVSLGILPNPIAGKSEIQLETAKHLIDLLGVLEEKTKGNLSASESGSLETTLHQLRMAYLEQSTSGNG